MADTINGNLLSNGTVTYKQYQPGPNINITDNVISGKDWSNDIKVLDKVKEDKLSFGYNTENKIISINNSALAGEGGEKYTAGENIDITDNVISGKDWNTEIESAVSGKQDKITYGYEDNKIITIDGSAISGGKTYIGGENIEITNEDVINVSGKKEIKIDTNTLYVNVNESDIEIGLVDAPKDNNEYIRKNGAWDLAKKPRYGTGLLFENNYLTVTGFQGKLSNEQIENINIIPEIQEDLKLSYAKKNYVKSKINDLSDQINTIYQKKLKAGNGLTLTNNEIGINTLLCSSNSSNYALALGIKTSAFGSGALTYGYNKGYAGNIVADNYGALAGGYTENNGIISAFGGGAIALGASYNNTDQQVISQGNGSVAIGIGCSAFGLNEGAALVFGKKTLASGAGSFAQGFNSSAYGNAAYSQGYNSIASGYASHAEGYYTSAIGNQSHAEGSFSIAPEYASHAEGYNTKAEGSCSHAEGNSTTASGYASHAEGYNTISNGNYTHAEGYYTVASGNYSHAEGRNTSALNNYTHVAGYQTITTNDYETVVGTYNISSRTDNPLFVVGNGDFNERSDAFLVRKDGIVSAKTYYDENGKIGGGLNFIQNTQTIPNTGANFIWHEYIIPNYFTVDLNNEWKEYDTSNETNGLQNYYLFYSNSNHNIHLSTASLIISGFNIKQNYEIKYLSNGETNYDFIIAYKGSTEFSNTKGHSYTSANIDEYYTMNITTSDINSYGFIKFSYKKDGSESYSEDRGYVLIPKTLEINKINEMV